MDNANDLIGELVGEGKKFKDLGELAKGKIEADRFIEDLKTENKALREIMSKGETPSSADSLEQKINLLLSKVSGSGSAPRQPDNQPGSAKGESVVNKDEVLKLLDERERIKVAETNVSKYNSEVTKAFGDKANEVVTKRLRDLSMDKEVFDAMVASSPQAALTLLGLSETKASAGSGDRTGSVNTEALFANQNHGVKNWAYFQRLRKEMGADYYKPHIQSEVLKSRKELGDDFWR